mmetsp:Transcript_31835/g.93080  ORF Transcript_31835/g.93080 Transcript_31835/m.93080 type:complete len:208 (-) Transcript_31835:580-1203(-)
MGYAGCIAKQPRSHLMPSLVTRPFRERCSSVVIGRPEHVRYFAMLRTPSFPMELPVTRRTSHRTVYFSSKAHKDFTPAAVNLFSEKSTLLARKRPREAAPARPDAPASAAKRRSIQAHHSAMPASPKPTSAIEMVSRCGCPGRAASKVHRVAHSGFSSAMLGPASSAGAGVANGGAGRFCGALATVAASAPTGGEAAGRGPGAALLR